MPKKYFFIGFIAVGLLAAFSFFGFQAFGQEAAKSLTLTSPNGGEAWQIGKTYDITWKAEGIKYVDIYINSPYTVMCGREEGNVWVSTAYTACDQTCNERVIAKNVLASAGKYSWTIPADQIPNTYSLISVKSSAGEANCLGDQSDNIFSIVSATTKSLTLLSPNGGEQVRLGSTYDITWKSNGVDRVNIYLIDYANRCFVASPVGTMTIDKVISQDCLDPNYKSSNTTLTIANNIVASLGKYTWNVPSSNSLGAYDYFKIKIEDAVNNSISDESDNYFSIAKEVKSLTLLSPNGGETWEAGKTYDITWKATGIDKIGIYLTNVEYEGGVTREMMCLLEAGCGTSKYCGPCLDAIARDVSASLGKYSWTIPADSKMIKAKIFIEATGVLPLVNDKSDNYFSIVAVCRDENSACSISGTCCAGLKAVSYAFSDSNGACIAANCGSICRPCGNGVCDINENICNCPEDCKANGKSPVIDSLSAPTQLNVNQIGTWTIKAHDPENGSLSYSVNWGDKITKEAFVSSTAIQTSTFTHAYSQAGTYTIQFTVTDDQSLTAKSSTTVSVVSSSTCTDSDGGKDYYVKGTVTKGDVSECLISSTGQTVCPAAAAIFTDECAYCMGACLEGSICPPVVCGAVKEYYCEGNEVKSETYVCPTGSTCKDGACTKAEKSLTLVSPNGGESWEVNSTQTVLWKSSGIPSTNSVKIVVRYFIDEVSYSTNHKDYILKEATPNDGSETVSLAGLPAGVYTLQVKTSYDGVVYDDWSDSYFKIIKVIPSIIVLSPNGGEQWIAGKTHEIAWSKSGFADADKMNIRLVNYEYGLKCAPRMLIMGEDISNYSKCGPFIYKIASDIPINKGIYSWTIPDNIRQSKNYKVRIETPILNVIYADEYRVASTATATTEPASAAIEPSIPPTGYYSDESDNYFSIIKPTTCLKEGETCVSIRGSEGECCDGLICNFVGYDYSRCEKPTCTDSDGGKNYYVKGTTIAGSVSKTDSCINVINTCPEGEGVACSPSFVGVLEYYCENNQIKSETIPCSDCKDGACVKEKSLTLTSPNGGEQWQVGKTYDITWKAPGYKRLGISLWKSIPIGEATGVHEVTNWGIVPEVSASAGKYGWTVPTNLKSGADYFVRIYNLDDVGYDTSDHYFSIVKIECRVFVDCVIGYFPVNTGKIDESGCPIIICEKEKPKPTPVSPFVCQTDADCQTGGCSGELCFKKGVEVASICLWKSEYECLKKIGCKCINSKCQWQKTEEFSECLGKISEAEENRLIKVPGKPDIYVIKNGKLHHIPSWNAFVASGYKMEEVKQVEEEEIVKRAIVNLIRIPDDSKVYVVGKGLIRHIPNPEVFSSYDFKWGDIVTVSPTELKEYGQANLIRGIGEAKVYLIENGRKRWIKTAEVFQKQGYDWSKIVEINKIELNAYSTGAEIIK